MKQADDMLLHFIRPVGRKLNGVVFFCKKVDYPEMGVFFCKNVDLFPQTETKLNQTLLFILHFT